MTCHHSRILILLLAYIVLEACAIFFTIRYLVSYLVKANGYPYTWKEAMIWSTGVMGVSAIAKYYFALQRPNKYLHGAFAGIIIFLLLLLVARSVNDDNSILARINFLDMMSNWMFVLSFLELLGVIIFMDYVIINVISKKFAAPVLRVLKRVVHSKQIEAFKLNSASMISDMITPHIDNAADEDIIRAVRKCFSRKSANDPWLKKILSIDYFNFSLPIDKFNRIKDIGERRKFMKYRPPDETKYWRIYLAFTALSSSNDLPYATKV